MCSRRAEHLKKSDSAMSSVSVDFYGGVVQLIQRTCAKINPFR